MKWICLGAASLFLAFGSASAWTAAQSA
jgi:hypothetical protein